MKERLVKIMIIIIIVLVLLFLGWLLYDRYVNNGGHSDDDVVVIDDTQAGDGETTGRLDPGEVLVSNSVVVELSKIFTTYKDEYNNAFKYSSIKKLSDGLDTKTKLYFTIYALDIDKKYDEIKCDDIKVSLDGKWSCGSGNTTTYAFSEDLVTKEYKYLFGSDQKINITDAEFENQRIVYDKYNEAWVLYTTSYAVKGEYASTVIDGAYVDEDTLTINIFEKLAGDKEQSVTLEFVYDEGVKHYVFKSRVVEEEVEDEY